MFRLILYTALMGGGTYLAAHFLPNSYKETILNKTGLGKIQGETFTLFSPASNRAKLLSDLKQNIAAMESYANKDETIAPAIEESKNIIAQLEKLNPKTGLVSGIAGKILGVNPPPAPPALTSQQITPELKAEICQQK